MFQFGGDGVEDNSSYDNSRLPSAEQPQAQVVALDMEAGKDNDPMAVSSIEVATQYAEVVRTRLWSALEG